MVTVRSARLVAAAVSGILLHLHRERGPEVGAPPPRTCIAVDGGVFVRYGFYRDLLVQGVRDILGDAVADQVRALHLGAHWMDANMPSHVDNSPLQSL
jgi:hexokinase